MEDFTTHCSRCKKEISFDDVSHYDNKLLCKHCIQRYIDEQVKERLAEERAEQSKKYSREQYPPHYSQYLTKRVEVLDAYHKTWIGTFLTLCSEYILLELDNYKFKKIKWCDIRSFRCLEEPKQKPVPLNEKIDFETEMCGE